MLSMVYGLLGYRKGVQQLYIVPTVTSIYNASLRVADVPLMVKKTRQGHELLQNSHTISSITFLFK